MSTLKDNRPQYYLLVEKPRRARRKIKPIIFGGLLVLAIIVIVLALWDSLISYGF